ncbi:hypothetical protein tinsulaeT_21900 [Thalassotalea insulae]|uniref:Imelysin-like domain-containing protein n=1 Tax=Thalassotalea insulae TaxID=2056778 RepID=A0ABQ6GWF5_9GAMM|nr:imelysin family protein [Thalassotalea insulae]GLX78850.1 hypothetical protein tinsulaeT_21900 [Thalassotalea insulae]
MFAKFSKSSLATMVTLALVISACGESTSSNSGEGYGNSTPVDTSFNEAELVTNLVDNVITPTFEEFVVKAEGQSIAVDSYCQAEEQYADALIEATELTSKKIAAQQAWQDAMQVWQQAEVMQLGPLLENDSLLRNNIYSWPNVNSCAVDYDVVFFKAGEVNGQPYDISKRTATRRGLAALEYLLFNDELSDSCETGAPDNWNNQTESYRKLARCQFASEVAIDLHHSASELTALWLADDGYANQLKQAGTANSNIETPHDAVNHISDAMFYLDSKTKDGKLAEPLGYILNECGSVICPESVESGFAHQSITHIVNNLKGFDQLLTGNAGTSFVDYLIDEQAQDTADAIVADVQIAINQASSYQASLAETLVTDSATAEQTHQNIKQVTDKLKTDFINSLALELPQTSAGDND